MKPLNRAALLRRIARDTAKIERRDAHALTNFAVMSSLVTLICSQYGVTTPELQGHVRLRRICRPRQFMIYLLKQRTTYTLTQIGWIFDVSPSSIIATLRTVNNGLETDCSYGREIAGLVNLLEQSTTPITLQPINS